MKLVFEVTVKALNFTHKLCNRARKSVLYSQPLTADVSQNHSAETSLIISISQNIEKDLLLKRLSLIFHSLRTAITFQYIFIYIYWQKRVYYIYCLYLAFLKTTNIGLECKHKWSLNTLFMTSTTEPWQWHCGPCGKPVKLLCIFVSEWLSCECACQQGSTNPDFSIAVFQMLLFFWSNIGWLSVVFLLRWIGRKISPCLHPWIVLYLSQLLIRRQFDQVGWNRLSEGPEALFHRAQSFLATSQGN